MADAELASLSDAVVRTIRDPLLVLDAELRVRSMNPAFHRTFRVDEKQALGRTLFELGEGQWNIGALRELMEGILPEDMPVEDFEIDYDVPDLGRRSMLLNARRLESEGEPLILLVLHDVTERSGTRGERRGAAERLRLQAELLEAVGQAVIAKDLDGRIIYWNRAAEELYGWSREEALGRSALEITPSEAMREGAVEIFETLREGGTWTGIFEVQRRDGSTFQALVNDAPMYDEAGELVGVIGVSSDISERVALEERLRQGAKMEAVGRLAAGVAHDFNNLLTAVEGHASILLAEIEKGSELREDVEEIRAAGRRAATLTGQLLAFSRKQKLEERRLDLRRVAGELQTMLARLVPARIALRVEGGAEDVVVRADPGQLQQVVMNLVVNAVDAVEDRGSITLSVDQTEITPEEAETIPWEFEPGTYARMTVRDTGSGMSSDVLDHIFEPFFTTKPEGTGLGLATVYGIVKQSGGHIFAESTPGRGTAFEVLLPRVAGAATAQTARPAGPAPSMEGAVVLLVEDDEAVRNVAHRILSRAGCRVLEAANGREALEVADRDDGTIDVVLSDVVMPDMGGVELQKELRARNADLKVVLTSGYSESEVHGEIRALGAAFVPKPFSPDQLLAAVAEALAKEEP